MRLWFDVEEGYKTTENGIGLNEAELWFDVEEGYKTTNLSLIRSWTQLWFDVEEGYKTTTRSPLQTIQGCGLMQKKDIRQLHLASLVARRVVV